MSKLRVAVMNTSTEITEVLLAALETEGIQTSSIFTFKFKENIKLFDDFVKKNNPQVIIYDIAIPYEENFSLFKKITRRPAAKGVTFILTTTNKGALDQLVGDTNAYEIIGKPFDLSILIGAVKFAAGVVDSVKHQEASHATNDL